nr:MAG TPA: hypothetical protein [Caudoviricetes sp.]
MYVEPLEVKRFYTLLLECQKELMVQKKQHITFCLVEIKTNATK